MSEEKQFPEDFMRCVAFHGHICPGLSIGYRAAKAGLDLLKAEPSEDEELISIVETDACGADAVQVLTGCTFGKGNFFYHDLGKQAFTVIDRNSGQGVRMCMRPDSFAPEGRHQELLAKVMQGQATKEEQEEFTAQHHEASKRVLNMPLEELFDIQTGQFKAPDKARIDQSVCCAKCGEPTMASKMIQVDEGPLCQACAG
jgi:formylmethanofuran dehydrogenase subunit E